MIESNVSAVLILGMHRSGTSLVAQACAAAGISPGPPGDLLAAQSDNPLGFYENRYLVEINDQFLKSAEASWFSPAEESSWDSLPGDSLKHRVDSLLKSLAAYEGSTYLLKDPRLCLTYPAWKPSLKGHEFVFVYRSP
ncbi:MAG: hypothetical protein AAF583_16335, partial [Pseudomonadota bacterium]